MSNIRGTATLIGDPPNIPIGSQVTELTFMAFIQYLTPPVLVSTALVLMYLKLRNSDVIRSRS